LFGASSASAFVAAVYGITDKFIAPFAGAFSNLSIGGGFVFDIATILAMIGYAILGWLIIRLLSFVFMSNSSF
jgi:hypothetical protein